MNEFDYDVWQKKIIARGSYHMKRGSRSKKCSLPHESLTRAQRNKLNGEVVNFKMNEPISWDVFKRMSLSSQEEYLEGLRQKFCVSAAKIAKDIFNISPTTLTTHIKRNGINVNFPRGTMSLANVRKWEEFICRSSGEPVETKIEDDANPVEFVDKFSCVDMPNIENGLLSEFSLTFSGDISATTIYNSLRSIIGEHSFGALTVSFKRQEG